MTNNNCNRQSQTVDYVLKYINVKIKFVENIKELVQREEDDLIEVDKLGN